MACGVPVVSTDCPGEPREILAPGTTGRAVLSQPEYAPFGVLVPVFDKQMHDGHDPCTVEELQLADVIVRVLQDKEMSARYVSAGLSRVRDFDHAVFLERYQRLIEKT
jgi:glycosyltransferase involved in cell wall biosynthesis